MTFDPSPELRYGLKAGDILAFNDGDFLSSLISVATGSLPGHGASHVSILAYAPDGELVNFESTSTYAAIDKNRCYVTGNLVKGVQAHALDHSFSKPPKIWVYRIRRPLAESYQQILSSYLVQQLGKPYDYRGAAKSFGGLVRAKLREHLWKEDGTTLFCSHLVGDAVNIFAPRTFENPQELSPNNLLSLLVSDGFYSPAERLK
jgi:hypothetical protein